MALIRSRGNRATELRRSDRRGSKPSAGLAVTLERIYKIVKLR